MTEVNALFEKSSAQKEVATGVMLTYSDSGFVKAIINSERLENNLENKEESMTFPKGIKIDFFDRVGNRKGWLIANNAVRNEKLNHVIARDSVVFTSSSGQILKSPELRWDEKTGRVFTDKFISFKKVNGDIIHGYGFSTNEHMTRYEILQGEGLLEFEQFEEDFK